MAITIKKAGQLSVATIAAFKSVFGITTVEGKTDEIVNKASEYAHVITDENGNIVFSIGLDGKCKLNIDPAVFLSNFNAAGLVKSYYAGKTLLAIGDSLTAADVWQQKVGTTLGMTVRTHAKGGISFIDMVEGYGTLAALTAADVTGVDVIALYGGYNDRGATLGVAGDLYPTQNTLAGWLQYTINKIYEKLLEANNLGCKVILITPHCCGKYGYIYVDGYTTWKNSDTESLASTMESVAAKNNIACINLWKTLGINKFNWNLYSSSATPNSAVYAYKGNYANLGAVDFTPVLNDCITVNLYTGYLFKNGIWNELTNPNGFDLPVYPWCNDQVHLNNTGYNMLGEFIAHFINAH